MYVVSYIGYGHSSCSVYSDTIDNHTRVTRLKLSDSDCHNICPSPDLNPDLNPRYELADESADNLNKEKH